METDGRLDGLELAEGRSDVDGTDEGTSLGTFDGEIDTVGELDGLELTRNDGRNEAKMTCGRSRIGHTCLT